MNVFASLTLAALMVMFATPAYAYIDPGTGGMLVQLITGGVAGVLVLTRLYWRRLKESLQGKRTGSGAPDPAGEPTSPTDVR